MCFDKAIIGNSRPLKIIVSSKEEAEKYFTTYFRSKPNRSTLSDRVKLVRDKTSSQSQRLRFCYEELE